MENDEIEVGILDVGTDEPRLGVYEFGYHIVPTVSEEALPKSVETLMAPLKAENASFVGERFPSKISLAYPITKRSQGKHASFDSAYFGWVAFEVNREALTRIKEAADKNPDILRYIIVKTDREAVQAAMTGAVAVVRGSIDKPKRAEEAGGEMSETALDEALETMEKEDAK
jgi:ribosomal protein S6